MTSLAISVEHLGKQYRIGGPQARYKTLRESLVNLVKKPWKKSTDADLTHIWALKDVSFEIQPGEVVGVIGRNGAGKSTLLKLLAHITYPTEGRVEIHGRIGSLLEVGTGFHPELTGRENIYLNGAVLGMKRDEIESKFDEIVDFSEIEKFLDTPAKRYSSGMYMRLAFAVAAQLNPEILLVDEVLAVGDAAFQKKCLGKMEDVAKTGRTVIFVSHNMTVIENLCQRVVWLNEGTIKDDGPTHRIVNEYLSMFLTDEVTIDLENFKDRSGTGEARIVRIKLLNNDNQPCSTIRMGESLIIRYVVRLEGSSEKQVTLGLYLHTDDGLLVSDFRTNHMGFETTLYPGETYFDLVIDSILLYPRTYVMSPWIMDSYLREDIDWVRYGAKFTVEASDFLGTGANFTSEYGITHITSHWRSVESEI